MSWAVKNMLTHAKPPPLLGISAGLNKEPANRAWNSRPGSPHFPSLVSTSNNAALSPKVLWALRSCSCPSRKFPTLRNPPLLGAGVQGGGWGLCCASLWNRLIRVWRSFPHSAVWERKKSDFLGGPWQRRKVAAKFYAWGNALDFLKEIEFYTSFSWALGLVSERFDILGRTRFSPPSSFCGGGNMRAERRDDTTSGWGPGSNRVRARLAPYWLPLLVLTSSLQGISYVL